MDYTNISLTDEYSADEHLLIIADEGHFEWADTFFHNFFSTVEINFLKNATKNKMPYILLPQENRVIIVQFLKQYDNYYIRREKARKAAVHVLKLIKYHKVSAITLINHCELNSTLDIAEGLALGNYQFLKYFKNGAEKRSSLKDIKIYKDAATKKEVNRLQIVTNATCVARDLINEPLSYLTAVQLSEEIKALGKDANFKVTVFDKAKLEELGMGGLLSVNMGSFQPPTFSICEWKPANAINKKPIVLVGKGVVYDTGGLSLKPTTKSMDFMKADMGGAAAVIGAAYAVAKAKLPLHVITLIPSTDNRPGREAVVPGDVVKMYDGTTVEVLNTDAEGRMLLADALAYAKQYDPELVMDFATLTGAAARALAGQGICYMGTGSESVKWQVEAAGFSTYERLVEFPIWEEYGEMMKSDIADLKNVGSGGAGMITAGKFLQHFTDYPWLHFDIAGSAFLHQASSYKGKNGTGVGVRLLFEFLANYKQ